MAKVLIVDDEPAIRDTCKQFLVNEGHEVHTADSGLMALEMVEASTFDVILSDIVMPEMNGIGLLAQLVEICPNTKMILFTGEPTVDTAAKALRHGAFDYLSKPVRRPLLCKTVANAAHVKELEDQNRKYHEGLEEMVVARTEKLRSVLCATIETLARTVEVKDPYTAGHQRRVVVIATAIAKEMGLSSSQIETIRMAGLVHDLGKIAVPAEILSKPGRISAAEFQLIKAHSAVGHELLKDVDFEWPVAEVVLQHHERLDGTGYPNGLCGEDIRLEARVIGVADVLEAMASHRPYREALGVDVAMKELEDKKGSHFDPRIVDACLTMLAANDYCLEGL